ncbi:histone deacetylase [Pseudobacteriovorax antillogorgiicola]|uniref:Acetoin utilization deacetylase AcuC n=1 Tax=Pseudobacteriovorax antillogorgiicola TaxID=1513793 RepID=A0A1Y6CWI1_9BACT|nr:histone deacetylase [Pseudobacteriovorax antillogorgiicola]TCS43637.1 acetoin utilization deacetylase AcuC-like enzyme [Pseudobacteriovorax antillogorgiicola]SMF79967.1 Acetoin utilization deacetylase AcuC [Pseudobacteriovorax antillogorgiicola]
MRIVSHPDSNLELDKFGITIPLTDNRVQQVNRFLKEANIPVTPISELPMVQMDRKMLRLAHNPDYVEMVFGDPSSIEKALIGTFELYDEQGNPNRFFPERASYPLHKLGKKALDQAKGAIAAAELAHREGASFFLGGGFHHAMSFAGRGFCFVNDIVMAARHVQALGDYKNIWIIDIDVHKGDGTAELAVNDDSLRTFSIHMAKGWPLDGPEKDENGDINPWFIPSDVDVPIGEGESSSYLQQLEEGLSKLLSLGKPDFVIVVQGSDPYEKDQLPSANLIKIDLAAMLKRDMMVYDLCKELQVPHCHLMAGGYGEFAHEPFNQFFGELKSRGHL